MAAHADDRPELESETDDRFPSCCWTGFYIQWGQRGKQDLILSFAGGKIFGEGADSGGEFMVRGTYDTENGRVEMTKRYDAHTVEYDGQASQAGIMGRWQIRYLALTDRGEFHIWPITSGSADAMRTEAEAPLTRSA
jgi:hypothetical protein